MADRQWISVGEGTKCSGQETNVVARGRDVDDGRRDKEGATGRVAGDSGEQFVHRNGALRSGQGKKDSERGGAVDGWECEEEIWRGRESDTDVWGVILERGGGRERGREGRWALGSYVLFIAGEWGVGGNGHFEGVTCIYRTKRWNPPQNGRAAHVSMSCTHGRRLLPLTDMQATCMRWDAMGDRGGQAEWTAHDRQCIRGIPVTRSAVIEAGRMDRCIYAVLGVRSIGCVTVTKKLSEVTYAWHTYVAVSCVSDVTF